MTNSIHIRSGSIYLVSGSITAVSGSSVTAVSTTGSEFISSFQLDPNDLKSFYISGSNISSSIYVSSSGRLGFGTTNPEAEIDFRADDWKIRKRAVASGIRMNEDGNFESFNNDTNAAATGSEIILKYTRGTVKSGIASDDRLEELRDEEFFDKTIAQADDVLGSIRFVADSGSLDERVGGEAGNIKMGVATSDATGVTGKLSINLAADPGAVSQQLYLINGATQKHEFSGSGGFEFAGAITTTAITAGTNAVIGSKIIHQGDTNNFISFGTDTQDYQTGGSSRLDISDSGVRLGGANARVTTVLDEDNMASDSATSLATQQSVKAYVDANAGGSVSGNTFATDLKIGRDADNLLDFTTDNQVTFRVSANDGVVMKASGEIEATSLDISGDVDVDGTLEADAITVNGTTLADTITGTTVTNSTNAAHVLITDNENTNEENQITFIEGAGGGGANRGLEADGDLTYNPSTGTVSATIFKGNIDAVDGDFDGTLEADALTIGGTNILTGGIVTTLGAISSNFSLAEEISFDARLGTVVLSAANNKTIIQGAASNLDIGAYELRAQTLEADVATGTAPLTIASTTVVSNLNADKLDGADLVDEDDMASDSATKVPTQQSVKAYVDARKSVLRSQSFYVNDNPFIQNSLYFGGTLNHQPNNWNDPQAVGGDPMTTDSFDISDDDQNWGMIIPYNISKIEILCGLRPGGTHTDQFSLVLYTASRIAGNVTDITLTRVAENGVNFDGSGRYTNNDLTYTANINSGTMIYVGVGTNTSSPVAKNARGYMSITITQR